MELVLQHIAALYGLELRVEERVQSGFLSENHVLTDGAVRYFLKKYRFDNMKRIEEVHAAKRYFSEHSVPVILPLQTKHGETFFQSEGGYYTLMPFVYGRQFSRGELSDDAVMSLGRMLGIIHKAGSTSTVVMEPGFKPWNKHVELETARVLLECIDKTGDATPFDRLARSLVLLKKKCIEENDVVYEDLGFKEDHLIHGDYLDHNVFFDDAGSNVTHVFDFEKAAYCARSYELFRSMTYSFWNDAAGALDLASSIRYFNAYVAEYPMGADEVRRGLRLFYLKMIHGFWVEGEHYLKGNTRVDDFLVSNTQRMQYLAEHCDDLADALLRE